MIPALDPATRRLPFRGLGQSAFPASVAEIEARFAVSDRRQRLLARFVGWLEDVNDLGLQGRVWMSGSYVTLNPDPSDIDVLLLITEPDKQKAKELLKQSHPLWTWQDVTATHPRIISLPRLQPFGGSVDAHYGWDLPVSREEWETDWTSEYDKTTEAPTGVRMGFLEVER